ncbi:acyl-CoA carboxylase subunit epsilon [Streptomyces sp. NBC_01431]|uniref:acyl-CoA carboxylase subunit epsilon n=1 Tax=Streptomyces sp. NBC_01431 TaxID=2903863 RepID=UPI002E33F904|nr:acyl-CoA carboxylase subunit epsilon [Streptomyces sp. NBC_01431]
MSAAENRPAAFHVVRGDPDPHELAALTAVLLGLARQPAAEPAPPPRPAWRRPRRAHHPGAGSWHR